MDARTLAAIAISEVLTGRSLNVALKPVERASLAARDRGFARELASGTLRWWPRFDWLLARLLHRKGLKKQDNDVKALLAVGLYQITVLGTPVHAAVAATAGGAKQLGKPWATALINGVLRSFIRQQDELLAEASHAETAHYAHPSWMLDAFRADWPDNWPAIVHANNERPPLTLRINRLNTLRSDYLTELANAGISAIPTPFSEVGLTLSTATDISQLPNFSSGSSSVQDLGAQLAAQFIGLEPGLRVLDACAAPGGKTCHMLELVPGLDVVAVDESEQRLEILQQNINRLQLKTEAIVGDASAPDTWWDGHRFDRILLDAPCSATGVIRRHPDIKLLRQPTDLAALTMKQEKLLESLWPLLANNGKLLYVTCSVLKAENRDQIERFRHRHLDAELLPLPRIGATGEENDLQILPGTAGMDGFYYALLRKLS